MLIRAHVVYSSFYFVDKVDGWIYKFTWTHWPTGYWSVQTTQNVQSMPEIGPE